MVVAYGTATPRPFALDDGCADRRPQRACRARGPDVLSVVSRRCALGLLLLIMTAGAARAAEPATQADVAIQRMTFVSSHAGVRDVVVEAERATLRPETNIAMLEGVHTIFAGRPGAPGFELSCDHGELLTATNDFTASGNVRGHTADGRSFTTDWVRYDHKRGLAYTDAPVEITENGGSYQGGGFRYYVREQRFRLLGGASLVRE